ncbi:MULTISPECIES: carbohydrate ABC transporter permease [Caproicibacterium]|uniref:Carbohydrate ABC transporter permease n=1 Tax=Caproicibacterium argilliputei TaxID=3030016 RepID=A0AA97H1P9_9FIRM|nr:carbohydrate ABC transporter permease [Caproicibacterium argilliputei]WOC32731.1 carbohydrate ABC transporter permease [Caproicibacterium argilliputei]
MKRKKFTSRKTTGDLIFDTVNAVLLLLLVVVTLYPFLNTLVYSLNDPLDSVKGNLYLWPRVFTLNNYTVILKQPSIYTAALVSVLRAFIGCLLNALCSVVVAYTLTKKDFVFRRFYSYFFIFSMYFSGGLIPSYFLIRDLHLMNNFLVYILPAIVSAWNIMVVRSYIAGLPASLIESAKIDGANELKVIFRIVVPLSMPVIACILLFVAVGQWNSWFDTMLYCANNQSLSTLSYELEKVLQSSMTISQQNSSANALLPEKLRNVVTPQSTRATMTIVSIIPILCVYPFMQKYFVKGITLGGVKG